MEKNNIDTMKWEGNFKKEVKGFTADQVWPFFEDFMSIHNIFPNIFSTKALEGELGKPGLVRYLVCSPAFLPPSEAPQPDTVYFITERLLSVDSTERRLSYQIIDNNVGINTDYVGTFKVDPVKTEDGKEVGCIAGWSVVVTPLKGRTYENFQTTWSGLFDKIVENVVAILSKPGIAPKS